MEIGVKEAATLLSVTEKTVYRWVAGDRIPYSRVGSQYRFSRSQLEEWILMNTVAKRGEREGLLSMPKPFRLIESLKMGRIHYRVSGGNRDDILRECLSMMPLPDATDQQMLLSLILEREGLCSTGVGNGFAMPHPRSPVLRDLELPWCSLNFLEKATDWHAVDHRPVQVLILILSPCLRSHLRIMAQWASCLQDPDFQSLCQSPAASREEIFSFLSSFPPNKNRHP